MNIGTLTASNYLIPQQTYEPTVPQQTITDASNMPDFGIPDPTEGLAYVEGVTKDYYDKWANLKSFAQQMYSRYGIDVTKPDYSNPESFKANELFNKAIADLQFQGDQLKTSQQMLTPMSASQRAGQGVMRVDPTKQLLSMTSPEQAFMSTDQSDFVRTINQRMAQEYNTTGDINRANVVKEEALATLERQKQNDPQNADYWEMQKAMITSPSRKDWRPLQERTISPRDLSRKRKIQAVGDELTKMSTTLLGGGDTWELSPYKNDQGEYLLITPEYSGKKYGPNGAQLEAFLKDPTTGKVSILFKGGDVLEVGATDVATVLKTIAEGTGDMDSEDIDEYLYSIVDEEGNPVNLIDESGRLSPSTYLEYRGIDQSSNIQNNLQMSKNAVSTIESSIKPEITDKLKELSSGEDITLKGALANVRIYKNNWLYGGGYDIKNIEEVFPRENQETTTAWRERLRTTYGINNPEKVDLNTLIEFLGGNEVGLFIAEYNRLNKENKKSTSTPTSPGFDPGNW